MPTGCRCSSRCAPARGGAGKEREAAQHLHGQVEVGEGSAADPGAVERQGTTEDLGVDPSDGLEQPQMRAAEPSWSARAIMRGGGSPLLWTGGRDRG